MSPWPSDVECAADGGHCITCSDEGVPMRVLSVSADGAVCMDEAGARHERIAVDLVEPVAAGDRVLVHAGVAIA
jgi:hydrogenase expression/formation protein HypC